MYARLKQLKQPIAIVGAGVTGRSVFDLLKMAALDCVVLDESDVVNPHFSDVASDAVVNVKLTSETLASFGTLIVSPGIDCRRDVFAEAQSRIVSDTELFAQLATKPIIGVTGSNGKSTVVSLLADAMRAAGLQVALCGNIGEGMLTAFMNHEIRHSENADIDYYVVELSSYQLERAPSLRMRIGVLLNISPDHLDRYDCYQDYADTKARVFQHAEKAVANVDDRQVAAYARKHSDVIEFGARCTVSFNAEVVNVHDQPVFAMRDFALLGRHNAANVAAVFAIALALDLDLAKVATACRQFTALPSRSVTVDTIDDVLFINDSKGTNVGATVACINGMTRTVVLLAGGQGKDQDFAPLVTACANKVSHVFLFGEDKHILADALCDVTDVTTTATLVDAFAGATATVASGQVVLLSPACASFDQFPNYLQRGEAFEKLVHDYRSQRS